MSAEMDDDNARFMEIGKGIEDPRYPQITNIDDDTRALIMESIRKRVVEDASDDTVIKGAEYAARIADGEITTISLSPELMFTIGEMRSSYVKEIKEIISTASPTEFPEQIKHRVTIQKAAVKLIDLYYRSE